MAKADVAAKTLKKTVDLSGVGLHSGLAVSLRIGPAPAGGGIRFFRTDLPGRPSVRAHEFDHNAAPFRTVIKHGAAEVHTVEHLLSALAGLGITDCYIEIDGVEVPGMDGSAAPFVSAIREAGISVYSGSSVPVLVVDKEVAVEDGQARISAVPYPIAGPDGLGGLRISYTLNYPGYPLAQGSLEIEMNEDTYINEIAPARTFAVKKDAEAMRAAGLGKGANLQNTVVIDGDHALETTLRFDNEPVRHKILDLIGDLYVLERPVHAHIIASCSGHRANRMLAKRLCEAFPTTFGTRSC